MPWSEIGSFCPVTHDIEPSFRLVWMESPCILPTVWLLIIDACGGGEPIAIRFLIEGGTMA